MNLLARALICCVVLFVAGCGDKKSCCGATSTPTSTVITDFEPAPAPHQATFPLVYKRLGGIGGPEIHLTVNGDGTATLDGFDFDLSASERHLLEIAGDGVDFKGNAGHDRGDHAKDGYVYTLKAGSTQVLRDDYVVPTPVFATVRELEAIATAHSLVRRKQEAAAKSTLITMQRNGGYASELIELSVFPNGTAKVDFERGGKRTVKVDADLFNDLQNELDGADLDRLVTEQDPNVVAADGFEYTLIYAGHTIDFGDPVKNPRLQSITSTLDQIVEANRPKP